MRRFAHDRYGRQWVLIATGTALRARLLRGSATPAVMNLSELVDTYGPLAISPVVSAQESRIAAFIDIVDLVAADPATASVEHIGAVARFLRKITSCSAECRIEQVGHSATVSVGRRGDVDVREFGGDRPRIARAVATIDMPMGASGFSDPTGRRRAFLSEEHPAHRTSGSKARLPRGDSSGEERRCPWLSIETSEDLRATLAHGTASLDLTGSSQLRMLVGGFGGVVLSPTNHTSDHDAFVEMINSVATDPETATLGQVRRVAAFTRALVTNSS